MLSNTHMGLQIMTNKLRENGEKVGLRINCEKQKTMTIGRQMHTPVTIGQQDVECV